MNVGFGFRISPLIKLNILYGGMSFRVIGFLVSHISLKARRISLFSFCGSCQFLENNITPKMKPS